MKATIIAKLLPFASAPIRRISGGVLEPGPYLQHVSKKTAGVDQRESCAYWKLGAKLRTER